MCGLVGVFEHDRSTAPDDTTLKASIAAMRHRGPDRERAESRPGIALGHVRLALLDPQERSDQPFWDEARRFALVFNGEIYNFRELRGALEREGVRFRTEGDTEVLLRAVLAWGPEAAVRRLDGMFAFGVYDAESHALTLARDRLGTKPLYVYEDASRVVFGSDIEALGHWLPLEPDRFAISAYLQGQGHLPDGATFFRGVRMLEPGTLCEVRHGATSTTRPYFTLPELLDPERMEALAAESDARLTDRLEEALVHGVERMLVADAPLGALCSGGVDSALLLALAARRRPGLPIFHADVVGRTSERAQATAVARQLGLTLETVAIDDDAYLDSLAEVLRHYAHPFTLHAESASLLAVMKLASRHGVKAVLTGEGSDECFIGYDRLLPDHRRFVRAGARRSLAALQAWLRERRGRRRGIPRAREGSDLAPRLVRALHGRYVGERREGEIAARLGSPELARAGDYAGVTLRELGHVLRTLLHRNDTMGMAASLEARFPYLDEGVVALAANLPDRAKVRRDWRQRSGKRPFLRGKWIVREVARRHLPREIVEQDKRGFPTTVPQRIEIPATMLDDSFVTELFGIRNRDMADLLSRAGRELQLALLHVDVWGRHFLHRTPSSALRDHLRRHVTIQPDLRSR